MHHVAKLMEVRILKEEVEIGEVVEKSWLIKSHALKREEIVHDR